MNPITASMLLLSREVELADNPQLAEIVKELQSVVSSQAIEKSSVELKVSCYFIDLGVMVDLNSDIDDIYTLY